MEQQTFDPNRTPFVAGAPPGYVYVDTMHGQITINDNTGMVEPNENLPGYPVEIPEKYRDIDQPFVYTCSPEKKDSSGMVLNRGCHAFNGCAIVQWFKEKKHRKPTNVIMARRGIIEAMPCHSAYCGVSSSGRPSAQVHYLLDGWSIITDRITVPKKLHTGEIVQMEVPNLAPFYEEVKAKIEAQRSEPAPVI